MASTAKVQNIRGRDGACDVVHAHDRPALRLVTKSWIQPGWDCRVKCKHSTKGDHGVHNAEWIYVVRDTTRTMTLSLAVGSGNYPASVKRRVREAARGRDITLHVTTSRPDGRDCGMVRGRCRTTYTSMLDADAFFKEHGKPTTFKQPRAFWEALKARFVRLAADVPANIEPAQRCSRGWGCPLPQAGGVRQNGEKWTCSTCDRTWVHIVSEAEGAWWEEAPPRVGKTDIHTETAAQMFGVRPDKVTPKHRQAPKRVQETDGGWCPYCGTTDAAEKLAAVEAWARAELAKVEAVIPYGSLPATLKKLLELLGSAP